MFTKFCSPSYLRLNRTHCLPGDVSEYTEHQGLQGTDKLVKIRDLLRDTLSGQGWDQHQEIVTSLER
jgi:hypothetical protein